MVQEGEKESSTPTQRGSNEIRTEGTLSSICSNQDPTDPTGADFPLIIADKSASSSYQNNLYFAVNAYFGKNQGSCATNPGFYLAFERSSNGGQTWTSPQTFDYSDWNTFEGRFMDTSANGTIYIVTTGANGCAGLRLLKSTNGGMSFTATCPDTSSLFRGTSVIVAASKTDGSTVYVVGTTCELDMTCPNTGHLYSFRSTNAGHNFGMPVRVDDILAPDNVQNPAHPAAVVSLDGSLQVTWYDHRFSAGNSSIADFYYSYTIGGAGFAKNTRLTPSTIVWCGLNQFTRNCGPGNDFTGIVSPQAYTIYAAFSTCPLTYPQTCTDWLGTIKQT